MANFAKFASGSDIILVKPSAGNLTSIDASSVNVAVRYLQLFDKVTAPVNTDVPIFSFPLVAGSATVPARITLDRRWLGDQGLSFAVGIGVAMSTTAGTLTSATAADHVVQGTFT